MLGPRCRYRCQVNQSTTALAIGCLLACGLLSLLLIGPDTLSCSTSRGLCPSLHGRRILQEALREVGPSTGADTGLTNGFHQVNDQDIFLYSAFLDRRFRYNYIRFYGIQSQLVTSRFSCEISYGNGQQLSIAPDVVKPIYPDWPSKKVQFLAYYYMCILPDDFDLSHNLSVSVRVDASGPRTSMPLVEPADVNRKRDLAICVKAVWDSVDASRLIEWIEMNRILGVDKMVFYETTVTGPARRVLAFYEAQGLVEVVPFTFALQMARIIRKDPFKGRLRNEDMLMEQVYIVAINDCYHRNRDSFNYVMLLDIDEIIVPAREDENLVSLVNRAQLDFPNASAFIFPTSWHFTEVGPFHDVTTQAPPYLHMQNYRKRTPVTSLQPKPIINSRGAITMNWHSVVSMPTGYGFEGNQDMSWERYGSVHHYRDRCKESSSQCAEWKNSLEVDTVMPRFASRVRPAVEATLLALNLLPGGATSSPAQGLTG